MPADASLQTVQRTVQILFAVAGIEDGCTVQQIAARTGIKPNTVYKFTRTLEREKLLRRKLSPLRFVLGSTLAELQTLNDERHLLTTAGRLLVRTQARLPEATFSLLEVDGTTTYQRLCVQSNRPGVLVQRREFVVPLYDKASSLLFLAYCHPDEERKFYEAHSFEEGGRTLWQSHQRLKDFLIRVRQLGYCQPSVPDREGEHFRVAAPVFSKGRELIAAIGGFIMNSEPKRMRAPLIRLCRSAADDLTRQIALVDGQE